ncbi:MAG: MATE family efflux transporter [Candidatus Saliniplasma sp.]
MFGDKRKPDILNGKIVPTLFLLGWPIMVESVLQTAYSLTDTFWLGNMGGIEGREALAATQISWPLIWLMVSVGTGFGIAAIALVSQHTGAERYGEVNKDAGQLMLFFLVFSTIIAIIGYLISPIMINSVIVDNPDVARQGIIFIRTTFISQPFMFVFMGYAFLLRAWGDTITPMIITGVAVGLNIILDPMFIYGWGPFPQWGIFGAAFATLVTRGIAAAIALHLLFRGKVEIKLKLKNMKPDLKRLKKFLKIGAPASIGNSGTAFGFVILTFVIARVANSEASLAAYNAGDKILGLMFIFMGGLAVAMTTMVGQNLGAGNKERSSEIVRKGILSLSGIMTIFTLILFLFRKEFIIIFNQDPDVVKIGTQFLLIFSLSMPFFGVFRATNAVFEGSGHTKYQMILNLVRLWGLRVPLTLFLGLIIGLQSTGVWIGMALSNVIAAIIGLIVLNTGVWKEKIIENT